MTDGRRRRGGSGIKQGDAAHAAKLLKRLVDQNCSYCQATVPIPDCIKAPSSKSNLRFAVVMQTGKMKKRRYCRGIVEKPYLPTKKIEKVCSVYFAYR